MAYNVDQLQQLQGMIGTEAEVPDAMDRYKAMQLLKRKPVRREDGGDMRLHDNVEEVASKGRYGDTTLIHVNPEEVRGLASIAPLTTNPETGLPEAFLPALAPFLIPMLTGAAIGGVGSWATGGDPLKGAAFGALGGIAGPAIGGLAGAAGLGGAWSWLGPIGQGMVVGGGMGGIRSLFGEGSDNPMRDILVGAAMGGVGGAVSGELGLGEYTGVGPNAPPIDIAQSHQLAAQPATNMGGYYGSQAGLTSGPNVPISVAAPPVVVNPRISPITSGNIPVGKGMLGIPRQGVQDAGTVFSGEGFRQHGASMDALGNVDTLGTVQSAAQTNLDNAATWSAEELAQLPSGNMMDRYITDIQAGSLESDPTLFDQASDWWGRQGDLTKAGIIGGGGLLASGLMAPEYPEPQEFEDEIFEFEKLDPLPLREVDQKTKEEILAQYLSSSPTAGDPSFSWFKDVNVSKQGGLVALANGGMPNLAYAGRNEDNAAYGGEVAHINANEADMLRRMGGAGSINPVTGLREYYTSGVTGNPGAATAGGAGVAGQGPGTAASGSANAAAAQGQGQSGPSGNFGFSVGPQGAVATQGPPGILGQGLTGLSTSSNPSSIYGIVANLANSNLGFDPGLVGLSLLGQFGHVAQKGLSTSILGFLAQQGVLGEGAQGLANAPTFARGDVGVTSSSITGEPSAVNTPSVNANTGNVTFGPTTTALPPPAIGPAVGQANGGIIRRFSGGQGTAGGAGVGAHEYTDGAAHPSGHPHPQQIGQPSVVFYNRRRGRGGGGPSKPVKEEIKVIPYTTNPFNFEERLASIGGGRPSVQMPSTYAQQQIALPTEASGALQGLLQRSSSLPITQLPTQEAIDTSIEQQGSTALADLFQRASDLPQAQEAADGGTVGLATGGNTPVFEGRVMGQGDGMADEVSFGVVPQTPADLPNTPDMALLSSDEYVMPADVVSMLGNGSSTAGSKMLDQFNQLLRRKAHGTNKQQTQLNAGKELSSLV